MPNRLSRWMVLAGFLFCFCRAHAQPALLSSVPANGATGVPTNSTVVFTFNTPMDTGSSSAVFLYGASSFVTATFAWSAGNTVLTCTPVSGFPPNTTITWEVVGFSATEILINPLPTGAFTTGTGSTGGGGGANGTNAITILEVGAAQFYSQTSSSPAVIFISAPYDFIANVFLSSNRFATNVTLTLPTAAVSNLTQVPPSPWDFTLLDFTADLPTFNARFPSGSYTFTVQSVSSNQIVTINLPSTVTMPQPPVPRVSNFPATQSVDPTQPFTLTWDAFAGGTSTDVMTLQITAPAELVPLPTNVLPATATSVVIPAGLLPESADCTVDLNFSRVIYITNSAPAYVTEAFRVTTTQFELYTTAGATSSLSLVNLTNRSSAFGFDVLVSSIPTVVVEYKTNLTAGTWQTLLTTNNPGARFSVSAPHGSNKAMFFRARSGP